VEKKMKLNKKQNSGDIRNSIKSSLSKETQTRMFLVNSILELAGDEFETDADRLELSKLSTYQLIVVLKDVADFYKRETQSLI
jgi:hypothetical protein